MAHKRKREESPTKERSSGLRYSSLHPPRSLSELTLEEKIYAALVRRAFDLRLYKDEERLLTKLAIAICHRTRDSALSDEEQELLNAFGAVLKKVGGRRKLRK